MRIYNQIKVPERTDKQQTSIICDICGAQSIFSKSWREDGFDATEIELMHKTGRNYGDCAYGTKFEIDICPECFENKLVPFLKSIAKHPIDYEEWDY